MSRFVLASLVVVLCLAPLSSVRGGIFQKRALQKTAVQKTAVQKTAVQKMPMQAYQKSPIQVYQKSPMQVYQKSPMQAFQKSMPVVAQKSVACAPCIRYVQRRPCRKVCCGCTVPVQTVLYVQDPRACVACPVAVPVCLPGCCVGAPQVGATVGLLGRGNVTYRWCCGYRVKIVFDNHGGVIVNYFGS